MVKDKVKKSSKKKKDEDLSWIFAADALDLDKNPKQALLNLFLIRFGMSMVYGSKCFHPDQNWQGPELAYRLAYGFDANYPAENLVTWEWLDFYALRTYIYPAYLSIPLHILKFLGMDSNFLVVNSMLFMNSLIQVLGDYYIFYITKDIAGKKGGIICLGMSVFNRRMNEIFGKTLTNAPESIFCMIGLYYYNRVQSKFDRNLILMTFSISIAFLVRSSSLIGWIPLALIQLFSSVDSFLAVLQAGLLIALPTITISCITDIISYGKVTNPQINFVHVNVVENISQYFGVDPWSYYIRELPEFIFVLDGLDTAGIAFSLVTVCQLNGRLRSKGQNKSSPYFLYFIVANLYVLSTVQHKEQRFMTAIIPLFMVFWAYMITEIVRVIPFFKRIFKYIFYAYILAEVAITLKFQLNYNTGDVEIYNLLHGRSPILLDYSDYVNDQKALGNNIDFNGFDRVESFFINSKYEAPITTWAHTPSSQGDKVTALFPAFQQPFFVAFKYFAPFKRMELNHPGLKIKWEPHIVAFSTSRDMITLIDEIENGGPLPQVIYSSLELGFGRFLAITQHLNQRIVDTGCYEEVGSFIFHVVTPHNYRKRHIFRILPKEECLGRMIKGGYYKNNKSLGLTNDFERAFMGYDSPMLEEVKQIKANNSHIFK